MNLTGGQAPVLLVVPSNNFYIYEAGNIVFQDRFDGTLSNWVTSGTVAISTIDNSPKMLLTNSSGVVSSKRAFTEPAHKYLVEFDLYYSAGNGVSVQLLDTSNNVIGSVDCGLAANTLTFDTDTATPTSVTFTGATYNQIVFCVDPIAHTIDCYWIDKSYAASGYNPLQLVASKAYSGTAIAALTVVTASGQTGTVRVDEVRIYQPDWVLIGDSTSDGKSTGAAQWSFDPSTTYRTGSSEDQTSPPAYQFGQLLDSNCWVGSRGFGGSRLSQMPTFVQELIVDQGFQRIVLIAGINSIHDGDSAATMEGYVTSFVATLLAGGFQKKQIYLANVYGSSYFNTTMDAVRVAYNAWLAPYCAANGYNLVDLDATFSNNATTPPTLKAVYDSGDGIHPNKTGYGLFGTLIKAVIPSQHVYYGASA